MQYRLGILFLMLAAASCARQQRSLAPDAGRDVLTRYHGDVAAEIHSSVDPSRHVIRAPKDSVWRVLPDAFERLDIDPEQISPSSYDIGNTQFVTRSIEGNRLSRFLRCGSSVGNSDNADTYRVTMSVITRVRVDDNGQTLLQTEITASAKPRTVSGNAVICSTTGRLERRIAEIASEILAERS